jgi:hypothetical protein
LPLTSAAAGELDSLFLRSPEPPLLLVLAASGDDWFGVSVTFSMTLASGKPPFAFVKPPHWLFWVGYKRKAGLGRGGESAPSQKKSASLRIRRFSTKSPFGNTVVTAFRCKHGTLHTQNGLTQAG